MLLVISLKQSVDWRIFRLLKYSLHNKSQCFRLSFRRHNTGIGISMAISKELQALCGLILSFCQDVIQSEPEEPE